MSLPLVAVIIPVFNVAPFLREAVESVINQTYKKLEIILVDDGSNDESGAICDEYKKDSRVTVIHQKHNGRSNARNTGLKFANGEYIAFLDADDAFHPAFIRTLLEVALRKNTDIVLCKYYEIESDEGECLGVLSDTMQDTFPSANPGLYNRKEALHALLNESIQVQVWNKLYKRKLWNKCRFPEEYDVSEDYISMYEVFDLCQTIYVVDQPLYFYRKQTRRVATVDAEKVIYDQINSRAYVAEFVKARIPETFSEKDLIRCKRAPLNLLLYLYCCEKEPAISKIIKSEIFTLINQNGKADIGIVLRAGYYTVLFCPWLIKILVPAYRRFKH